jgi:branched-chain amino acid transport system ATP-binding protein
MSEQPLLRLTKVNAWYGIAQALFDVDLEVGGSECVALMGRNGAGKTTAFRTIMSVLVRSSGRIEVGSKDVRRYPTTKIARLGVGWVPEDRRIFPDLTVRENIQLASNAVGDRKPVGIDELVRFFPILEGLLPKPGNHLSGGEQQVVAIARALAGSPRVLLLDEPAEGLAPVVVDQLAEGIRKLSDSVSILIAEQNLQFIRRLCNRVYVLETGRVVYSGTVEAFEGAPELVERYLSFSSKHVQQAKP